MVGHRVAVEEVNSEDTEWENSVHTPIQQASTALTSYDCCSVFSFSHFPRTFLTILVEWTVSMIEKIITR